MQSHPYGALPRRQPRLGQRGPDIPLAIVIVCIALMAVFASVGVTH